MRLALNTVIFIGLFLVVIPLIIQIIVCKNTKGSWGLIIPVLSFINSFLLVFGQWSFDSIAQEQGTGASFILSLLIVNIPTLIYFLIHLYYKNKKNKKDELDKMEIMDM